MLELFTKAGTVAWPLGIASVLALGIILERLYTLSRLRRVEDQAFRSIVAGLEKGDRSVIQDRSIAAAPVARIVDSLSEMRGASADALQYAAEIALSLQRVRLRRYLGTLATIASTAPFIGLFGTVIGVMRSFHSMSRQGLSGEMMSAGISEALSATAVGLLVAVPSVIAYNFFTGRVTNMLLEIQKHLARIAPLLQSRVLQKAAAPPAGVAPQ